MILLSKRFLASFLSASYFLWFFQNQVHQLHRASGAVEQRRTEGEQPKPTIVDIPSSQELESNCNIHYSTCLDETAQSIARPWTVKPLSTWCGFNDNYNDPNRNSDDVPRLLLTKVPKSASSTTASVVLRLSHQHQCPCQWRHGTARELLYHNRTSTATFLLAPIRDPSARALSSVYFHKVSFHRRSPSFQKVPSDPFIQSHLEETPSNYISEYVRLDDTQNNELSVSTIQTILQHYDFLLVVDQWEESITVLSLLLKVPISSLVTLSTKQAGSWYLTGKKRCVQLVRPVATPTIASFLDSAQWKRQHVYDRLLHRAAAYSLNQTIHQTIGRETFQKHLSAYQTAMRHVQQQCANTTHFPCSRNGEPQLHASRASCYARDFGCGYPCIDQLQFAAQDG